MKCKIVSLALVVATLVLLSAEGVRAQTNGKIKFLRPLQLQWAQSAGRSDSAGSARGLMKHFMMFKNMWQQPSSNVVIITRPTAAQNDGTTTTTTQTEPNEPTGRDTRLLPRQAENKATINDDELDDDVKDGDGIQVLGTKKQQNLKGVQDKISMKSMQGNRTRLMKRNKKRQTTPKQHSKRRKQIIDVESILKREEDRRRNGGRRTKTKPKESSHSTGNFMRFMNSFRLQPSVAL